MSAARRSSRRTRPCTPAGRAAGSASSMGDRRVAPAYHWLRSGHRRIPERSVGALLVVHDASRPAAAAHRRRGPRLGARPYGDRAGQRAGAGGRAARGPAGRAGGRAAPVGRGDAGAEQRRRDRRRSTPTATPTSRCGRRARRPRSRSTSWSPSCARTARSTTCSPALDPAGLDPTAARLLEKTLEEFRRAGVDQDDATRARLAEISERITVIDQEFSRNIRDDVRTVQGDARAAGRPAGGLAGRAPGRRRRPGHGDDRLPGRGPGADVRAGRRRPSPDHRRLPRAGLARTTSRCSRSCSTCATSTPTWSATPTGRRTTPR